MNDYIKIKSDIDDATAKKLKELIKQFKKSQDETIEKIAVILLDNLDDNGVIMLSDDMALSIRDELTKTLSDMNEAETKFLYDILEGGYSEAFTKTAAKIGLSVDWNLVKPEFVARAIATPIAGKIFSDRVWENTNELANRIYNDIIRCVEIGIRPREIAKQIKDDFGVSAYQAARLVNTELAKVVSDAQLDVYRNSGVVDKIMWMATLESNTCDYCAEMDGKEFLLNDAPKIPAHPNCRCCYVPIVDGYKPGKRADNETHKNIDYKTFNEWKGSK